MPRIVHILWISLIGLLLAACARDVNPEEEIEPYPDQIRIAFSTGQAFSNKYWYYMVFNFSAAPNTAETLAPIDEISNEDRCANWEMYIGYHKDPETGEELVTFQRPRVPTIVDTAIYPTDVAGGQMSGDDVKDLLVACRDSDVVQIIKGIDTDPDDPLYFESAEDFDSGTQPIGLHIEDYTSDDKDDVSIIYAGNDTVPAVLRVLEQGEGGTYSTLNEIDITDTPIAAIDYDLNGDTAADWVILARDEDTGDVSVQVYGNNGNGEFITSSSYPVDDTAIQVICGQVNDEGVDILVAQHGLDGGDGSIAILNGDGSGNFSAGPTLDVEGNVNSITLGAFVTNTVYSLLVCYTNSAGAGRVAMYQNDGDQNFTKHSDLITPTDARYVTALNTNGANSSDRVPDALILDGDPETNMGTSLYIVRGKRKGNTATGVVEFEWDEWLIDYLTGEAPTSIIPYDLSGNGVEDLLIPNSGSSTNGNSVSVFYGLGNTNYTNADVYWTDELPEVLGSRDWLEGISINANVFQIIIDPNLFYDLTRVPPDQDRGFNVTFMTTTTGVHYLANEDQLGEVLDYLTRPINIPMEVGHYDDDQNTPLADFNVAADASADITDWVVEVR